MSDIQKTQHYTTMTEKICGNLKKYIPGDANLVEPFVGKGDLLSLFPQGNWEVYDISADDASQKRDTLLEPPHYSQKWVITNPPYLAKNKAKDKSIFIKYDVDDLYKAAILSIMECEGGILIIPTNFFSDERTSKIRRTFLDTFQILELNIFTEPVFSTTTYSVCSFAFARTKEAEKRPTQDFPVNLFPKEDKKNIQIYQKYGYRFGGEYFARLEEIPILFSRLTKDTQNKYITNIKLYAIDSKKNHIRAEYDTTPFVGKNTDRTFATFVCDFEIDGIIQHRMVEAFNKELQEFRDKYFDVSLTNYRDYNRKRISFVFAYQLLSKVYKEIQNENRKPKSI